MMENISIISELITQGNKETFDLYSKIPYKLRKGLDAAICNEPWDKVSEGCEQHDEGSLLLAEKMYQHVLRKADEYISINNQRQQTDNSAEMMVEKFRLMSEFENKPAKFVFEMAKCLKREKELIFTYPKSGNMMGDMVDASEDTTAQMEDGDLRSIEDWMKGVDAQLEQVREFIKGLENNYGQLIQSGTSLCEINEIGISSHVYPYKQQILVSMQEVNRRCSLYATKLTQDLGAWKSADAKWSVKVGPEPDTSFLLKKYRKFGSIINTIMDWFSENGKLTITEERQTQSPDNMDFYVMAIEKLRLEFENIISSLMQIIVIVQPKGAISIENKGNKGDQKYCTKKTQSFSTALSFLPGESFGNFHIKAKEVELFSEREPDAAVTSRNGQSCLKVESPAGTRTSEIEFNIEVTNFTRVEQNNVYKQFFRLRYTVVVSVNNKDYTLQTISLPFTFNTGANQILEHKGARMWYCAGVDDLYKNDVRCPDPLPVEDVINMLDNKVAHISKKGRRLTELEKTFLRERLPVASDGKVTMQGFLKDKMKTLRFEEPLNYSFYTWFYAVINSIELLLLDAWLDGIIYGFCSDKEAKDLLMGKDVPDNTFLLRPSASLINKTSSVEATAGLTMEVKLRIADAQPFDSKSSQCYIKSIPLMYNHIEEYTLYNAIKGVEINDKPVAKFLYRRNGNQKLNVLKRYGKKQQPIFLSEYEILIEKVKKLKVKQCSKSASASTVVEVSDAEEDGHQEPTTRKRRYRKSSSSTQNQSVSQLSPLLSGVDDSSRGSVTLPHLSEFSPEEIKPDTIQHVLYQSGAAVNEQCSRSGTRGKKMPGSSDKKSISGKKVQNEGEQNPANWCHFQGVLVDFSNIPKSTSTANSPSFCDQNDQASQETGQNRGHHADFATPSPSHHANFATPNSDNSRVSNHMYNEQYQERGINHFIESTRSPGRNVGYNVSSPAPTVDYSLQNLTSVNSLPSSSVPSPGSVRMSPPPLNAEATVNLPTVINDASESKKQTRRRGTGSKTSRRRSPTSTQSETTLAQIIDQSTSSQLQFIHNEPENCSYLLDISQINFDPLDQSFISLGNDSDVDLNGIVDAQMFVRFAEHSMDVQLSPDSGMGDQSPSPISSLITDPLSIINQPCSTHFR